jgi:hypothetical protein
MLSGFTARQSTCRVVCRVSLRYHPSHATQGPSESLLPSPTQRFFARMTPDRPLIFTSRTSDPGQPPLNFLSLSFSFPSFDMQGMGVGARIHRDGADGQPVQRAQDAAGDGAAVGDQNLVEHGSRTSLSRRGVPPIIACAPGSSPVRRWSIYVFMATESTESTERFLNEFRNI